MKQAEWVTVLAAVLVTAAGGRAMGADFTWDGTQDGSGVPSGDSSAKTGINWVGDVAPGDTPDHNHVFDGTPLETTIDYPGSDTSNDLKTLVFAPDLAVDMAVTGEFRMSGTTVLTQNSARQVDLQAKWRNYGGIDGSGSGTVTVSGECHRPQGRTGTSFTINNNAFRIDWTGTLQGGNEWWRITKAGDGLLSVTGTFSLVNPGDSMYDGDNYTFFDEYYLDVTAGTVEVGGDSGRINGGNIRVNGGTFKGGSGTLAFYISGTDSDLIDFNSGVLNLSTLTIDLQELGVGATETEYVIVDYSASASAPVLSCNPDTDNTFGDVENLPAGYSFEHDAQSKQIKLVPEPASAALLALGGVLVAIRRRRRR